MKALSIIVGLIVSLALAMPASAQNTNRWRRGSTAQAPSPSATSSATPAPTTSSSATNPVDTCAAACSSQYNICIHGNAPDLEAVCGKVAACASLTHDDFVIANSWYASCIASVTQKCLPGCTPPQVTTTTPTPHATTPRTYTAPANTYRSKCEREGGVYIKTETTEGTTRTTREECYKAKDLATDVAELKRQVATVQARMDAGQPVVIDSRMQTLYLQVVEITKQTNVQTQAIVALARSVANDFSIVRTRLDALERRVGDVERNIGEVGEQAARAEAKADQALGLPPQVAVPGQAQPPLPVPNLNLPPVYQQASLPCWLALYAQTNFAQTYGYTLDSLGGELGCSLFSSQDGQRSFVLAGGFGMKPTQYFDHTLAEVHFLAGSRFKLGDNVDFFLLGGDKIFKSTTWEKGTVSMYGAWPEVRHTWEKAWFLGGRVGVGIQNVAPPKPPEEIDNGRSTHFPVFDGAVLLGRQF